MAADRLAVHKLPSGVSVTHTYRFDNLRYARQGPNGTDGQLWDGSGLIGWSRKDNSGSTDGQPAQAFSGASDGPDVGRALGTQTGTGTVGVQRQYHTDEQGNVLAISDDSQATAVSYDIGAFGNVRSGSATDQPLDFVGGQGYQRDADAGTLYVRARHYDPATGEWLSQDPIEGEPAYAYGYNAPTAFTDASGMQNIMDEAGRQQITHTGGWAKPHAELPSGHVPTGVFHTDVQLPTDAQMDALITDLIKKQNEIEAKYARDYWYLHPPGKLLTSLRTFLPGLATESDDMFYGPITLAVDLLGGRDTSNPFDNLWRRRLKLKSQTERMAIAALLGRGIVGPDGERIRMDIVARHPWLQPLEALAQIGYSMPTDLATYLTAGGNRLAKGLGRLANMGEGADDAVRGSKLLQMFQRGARSAAVGRTVQSAKTAGAAAFVVVQGKQIVDVANDARIPPAEKGALVVLSCLFATAAASESLRPGSAGGAPNWVKSTEAPAVTGRGRWTVSDWFAFWKDRGGYVEYEPLPKDTRKLFGWHYRVLKIVNRDQAGTPGWVDTHWHEACHVYIINKWPGVMKMSNLKLGKIPVGAPVKYLNEVLAYGTGHIAAARPHAVAAAPVEAFFSLKDNEVPVVVGVMIAGGATYVMYTSAPHRRKTK